MKFKRIMETDNSENMKTTDNSKEFCVVCGCLTDVDISMPVDLRETYIDGAGQLCENVSKK